MPASSKSNRRRLREHGVSIGQYLPGRYNAITDVPGVLVGHSTLVAGDGPLEVGVGPVRTGVTAILPNRGRVFDERVVGSGFILNGAGEISGLTQVMEWGLIETPIILTNTLSVGTCSEAVVDWMLRQHPGIGQQYDVVIPVVGECDDSWLNDAAGRHVRREHVHHAISTAQSGPVEMGSVGGGTGMVCCDLKGGIGSSSRRLPIEEGGFTIGVLVMSNFGVLEDLRIDGAPVGRLLARETGLQEHARRVDNYGSIIAVVATNAPLHSHQITRLCKRVALGIGRAGSWAAHGSGEIVIGFSTANKVPRESRGMTYRMKILLDQRMNPLYRAAVEATEEAIMDSMCMATAMTGHSGHHAPALPLEELASLLERARRQG
ncbi:MAG: P1 family peptidase [Myxococcales bacterium]|nr:P1 family peptidase [Myxococcales bacterium]